MLTRPVRTLAGCGCGCDDAECEYSRIRESFALGVLDTLPESYASRKLVAGLGSQAAHNPWGPAAASGAANLAGALLCSPVLRERVRPCPPCPTDPWVILADFKVDDQGTLDIDPIAHRRYVVAFGSYFFMCGAVEINQAPAGTPLTAGMKKLLAGHIDAKAMPMVEDAGHAEAALDLAATAMKGVTPRSKLGQFLAGRTIGSVAATERGVFLQEAEAAKVDVKSAAKMWEAVSGLTTGIARG
jgi:hypothetical protein